MIENALCRIRRSLTVIVRKTARRFLNGPANVNGSVRHGRPGKTCHQQSDVAADPVPEPVLFCGHLDRVNVGFAKLHKYQVLGLSEAAFGLGAGLFFVGYFIFEVPSNIFLEKVGARVWIARIMITWGIVSAAFAFIPSMA